MAKLTMQRDPRLYFKGLAIKPINEVRALSLDLSLTPGVGMLDFDPTKPIVDRPLYLDMWDLHVGDFESAIVRYVRLRQLLECVMPDIIFFEDVKFTGPELGLDGKGIAIGAIVARATKSIELQGALKITVSTWAHDRDIPCVGFNLSTIKKHATGKGNCGKPDMIRACNEKFGTEFDPETYEQTGADNLADAAHLMDLGLEHYAKGLECDSNPLFKGIASS